MAASFAGMPARTPIAYFFLVVLFLCSWHLDHGTNANTMSRAASVASLVDRGTLEITPLHELTGDKALVDGRYYSDKAPLPTFVVLPFHWILVRTGLVHPGEHGTLTYGLLRLGGFLCGSLPLAVLIILAWTELRRGRRPLPLNAALLAALPLLGSFFFVYSGSFYNHLPGALFAVLGARSMQRGRPLEAGLWGSAAFLCESVALLLPAVWAVQQALARRWKAVGAIMAGMLPGLVGAALYNLAVTGDPLVFPNAFAANYEPMHHGYGFGTWQPRAFMGLLVSDHRGLLFYMPVLVVGVWTLPRLGGKGLLRDPYVLPALLTIAAFLTHATWWGGWTYGPRYLMAAAALLFFALLPLLRDRPLERWSLIGLSAFGLVCAVAAKATIGYSLPTEVPHPLFTRVFPAVARGEWSMAQWPVLLGVPPVVASLLFLVALAWGLVLLVRIDRSVAHAPVPLP